MKVCYLADNGSVHNQKWIEALSSEESMELHVISFRRGVEFKNVTYHPMKHFVGSKLDYVLNAPVVSKLIEQIRPDILHAHYATSYGFLGSAAGFHPFIITGWGADIFDSTRNPIMKLLLRRSFAKADAITVLSEIALKEMKKLSDKQPELIPFGVDVKRFKPAEKKTENIFRIGTIRTLSEKYGVEYLIRAFAILYKKYPQVQLEIVGDGNLRNYLQNLVNELNIGNRVAFHGYINQKSHFEKYYNILSNLDVFCIPSILDSETFGVAAVEASACGIPIVASQIGGLSEVIVDGETGILVATKNPEEIAAAIESLINNRELKERMGSAGRIRAVSNYSWDESMVKMMNVYKRILTKF